MRHSRGFSLIESAVALAVLGMITMGAITYWKISTQQQTATTQQDLLVRADNAITGFAFANSRLPCPDTNASGLENCSGTTGVGGLPWRTLGLAEAGARNIRYGVYRHAHSSGWLDADLARSTDRFRPLLATGSPPVALEMLLGQSNGLDFCFALNTASALPFDATALNTASSNGTTYNVAYALALPGLLDADGDGNFFDGKQATQTAASPAFDAPQRPMSATYDDKVLAQGFDALFSKLSCGQALAAAGHTHFNAATAAALTSQGLIDYKKQLDINVLSASAAIVSATGTVLTSVAGIATAVATTALATAEAILSYGAVSGIIAAGAFDVATNAATTIVAAASLTAAIVSEAIAIQRSIDVVPMVNDAATLSASITANAKAADAAGL